MTARMQHIVIRDHMPRVRELAQQRSERERRARAWATVKRRAEWIVTAALVIGSAYALWAILGRVG